MHVLYSAFDFKSESGNGVILPKSGSAAINKLKSKEEELEYAKKLAKRRL